MSTSQKSTKKPILNYYPAQVKKGKKGNWRVEFYVMNPIDSKMKRIQRRVRPIGNQRFRERYAKQMAAEVNSQLERGWNPIVENEAPKVLALLTDVAEQYINQLKKAIKDKEKREDTLRTYQSFIQNLKDWMAETNREKTFCLGFNRKLIYSFLDEIYYVRNNSARTHNNYLGFLVTFGNYLKEREYISANPADGIKKKNASGKKRTLISAKDRKTIVENTVNKNYLNLLMAVYYELIRRTELTKLKVSDVMLADGVIKIRPEVSKNRMLQYVSIIDGYAPFLIDQLKNADKDDFLFSGDNFRPGKTQLQPKKVSDEWSKLRKAFDFPKTYQLYSLKDSGITDMLNAGIPAIIVRDHARHHSVAMTERYTPVIKGVDVSNFKNFRF